METGFFILDIRELIMFHNQNRSITTGNYDKHIKSVLKIYEERRNILVDGLKSLGWKIDRPKATFYVWTRVPARYTSATFAAALLEKCDIVATPGNGFGENGEGYIRFALTVDKNRIKEAVKRIKDRLI